MHKLFLILLVMTACNGAENQITTPATAAIAKPPEQLPDSGVVSIHVMVALCDNKYQGIVPVPAAIGNGQNAATNLYWGCALGIKSYFKKSDQWQLLKSLHQEGLVLERLIFKHRHQPVYLVADAYDGKHIKQCSIDFLNSCAGINKNMVPQDNKRIGTNGNASLLAYIGHNGLMDFGLADSFVKADSRKREAIILACKSKGFFAPLLRQTGAQPLLWTTGLMAPEAYTLHDAIESWLQKRTDRAVANAAAAAYARYQHCGIKAARRLLVTGW